MNVNPLLEKFDTLHQTAPYRLIKPEHFMPAIHTAISEGKNEIDTILDNKEAPDFNNTILALEQSGTLLEKVSSLLFHLNSAETSPELQEIVRQASPLLTEYANDISLNPLLFNKIKIVWEKSKGKTGDAESNMLLEKTFKGFTRNGANLPEKDKERFRSINKELAELSIRFSENILHETNAYTLKLESEEQLSGLPGFAVEAAREAAERAGYEGWIITLHAPSYIPFIQYATDRGLREKLFTDYNSRGFNGNQYDNSENIRRIVALRYEKAVMLGYKTWADYVLEERMADKVDIVDKFLENIRTHAEPAAHKELEELTVFARENGFSDEKLQRWDTAFYSEKLKKQRFSIDDEILKPYFRLDNVLKGIFLLAEKLYDLSFTENPDIQVWHEEVKAYEVNDKDGNLIAVWFGDYFPRPGKRAGAWNNTIQGQCIIDGIEHRPHVVNVCNFSRPSADKPSLLTFNEVTTLFHEFGHALHAMLAKGKYASLTGTSVAWDFVELPSQIMENFATEPDVLKLFAFHYQSGEVIPEEYIVKIKESSNFMSGLATVRQLGLGKLDMSWHDKAPADETIAEHEARYDIGAALYPEVKGIATSPAFSHIFAGGYSAGYYSYKWSEVLDADAYEFFKEKGIFNKEVAESFRENILSAGGSEKPMELYRRFRGREPRPEAMLRRAGLIG